MRGSRDLGRLEGQPGPDRSLLWTERKREGVSYIAVQPKASLGEYFSQNQLTKEFSVSQEPACLTALRIHTFGDAFQSVASGALGLQLLG